MKRILGETTVDLSLELRAEVGARKKVGPMADLSHDLDDLLTFCGSLTLLPVTLELSWNSLSPSPLQFQHPAPHSPRSPASFTSLRSRRGAPALLAGEVIFDPLLKNPIYQAQDRAPPHSLLPSGTHHPS